MRIERRFYKSVGANSSETDEYIVPSGQTLQITKIGGNASAAPSTVAKVIWDFQGAGENTLLSTHGDSQYEPLNLELLGDGVKKLAIVLMNDQLVNDDLGGFWQGELM